MNETIVAQITGVSFESEFETAIDKKKYNKMKKWLEDQLFHAKRCIKKIRQMCEVYFESEKVSGGYEQFYISICQNDGELDFSLKKRIAFDDTVNEKASKITKGQFASFVGGEFEDDENSDDLVFEFCQKAKIHQLKASYACHFEREEYIFKKSGALITIDKDMDRNALSEKAVVPKTKNNYRVRIYDMARENDFYVLKKRLLAAGV